MKDTNSVVLWSYYHDNGFYFADEVRHILDNYDDGYYLSLDAICRLIFKS